MKTLQAAGGLFILGFDGTRVDDTLKTWVELYRPAGFVLFARNIVSPQQIAQLSNDIHRLYPENDPPLISVDQEGGRVARLGAPFNIVPEARALGRHYLQTGSLDHIHKLATITAKELKAVGINLNFAPVLDVDSNPDNPIIADRAYANNPKTVAAAGCCVIKAYQKQGLLACGKHFPGHGDTNLDSHYDLPVVQRSRRSLDDLELIPFRTAIETGVASLMTAHVLYPTLDEIYPATLSHNILTRLLREELGFKGLIITDNMEMRGVWGRFTSAQIMQRSVEAGCDLFIGGGGGLDGQHPQTDIQFNLINALAEHISNGTVTMFRIEQSLQRIQTIKQRYLSPYYAPKAAYLEQLLEQKKVPQQKKSTATKNA